ncbi:hypothetical protein [uncultured Tenacibaculum sp.]|uniref:hypothetical protein n=1 Tax=uncultured Tenacibaculum sp. TaxID=174713 RepID=UPI002635ECB3|nr:hypothetical protein [uncultured Tenacibaculum sp.]
MKKKTEKLVVNICKGILFLSMPLALSNCESEINTLSPDGINTTLQEQGLNEQNEGISLPVDCQGNDCSSTILANKINELLDKSLNEEELLWLFNNEEEAKQIKNYLEVNQVSSKAKKIAKFQIETNILIGLTSKLKVLKTSNLPTYMIGESSEVKDLLANFSKLIDSKEMSYQENLDKTILTYFKARFPYNNTYINIETKINPDTPSTIINEFELLKIKSFSNKTVNNFVNWTQNSFEKEIKVTTTKLKVSGSFDFIVTFENTDMLVEEFWVIDIELNNQTGKPISMELTKK